MALASSGETVSLRGLVVVLVVVSMVVAMAGEFTPACI
jgi:hypothetical protein